MALISSLALSLTVIASLAARMLARSRIKAQALHHQRMVEVDGVTVGQGDIIPRRRDWETRRRGDLGNQSKSIAEKIQSFLLKPGAWWNEGLNSPTLARPYRKSLKFSLSKPLKTYLLNKLILVNFFAYFFSKPYIAILDDSIGQVEK